MNRLDELQLLQVLLYRRCESTGREMIMTPYQVRSLLNTVGKKLTDEQVMTIIENEYYLLELED